MALQFYDLDYQVHAYEVITGLKATYLVTAVAPQMVSLDILNRFAMRFRHLLL